MHLHLPQLRTLLLILLALPMSGASQDKKADPELERARTRFGETKEESCNAGVDICVRKNNVAAVELMLEILRIENPRSSGHLPPPHYRDIVWGGLALITDPYARKRVESEMRSNRDSAWMRQWCAELLGEYRNPDFGDSLVKALGDRDIGVRRAAAQSLGRSGFKLGTKALAQHIGERDHYLRANVIESLARIEPVEQRATLLKGLKDKDGGVRCALLGAAAEIWPDDSEVLSIPFLKDDDWRPRMQAVDNLGSIRTKGAVDALILALADGRPAVAARAQLKLQELTAQKHSRKDSWEAWWKANRETFEFPEGRSKVSGSGEGVTTAYHGIALVSDHAAFLIDRSEDMQSNLKSQSSTKEAAALKELERVLAQLQGRLVFDVFTYAEQIASFGDDGPVALTEGTRKAAIKFVEKSPSGNAKDIWQLLEKVVSEPDLDTAYLLSSGEPDIGTYVHWNRVTWHLRDMNRFHKMVVHTIAYSDSQWYRDQLEKIAETTGGEFRWFE